MKKRKVKYSDEPIREVKIVNDFLPKPRNLVLKEKQRNKIMPLTAGVQRGRRGG